MLDLFDAPVLPGIATVADIVSPDEEAALVAAIDSEPLTPFQFQQWEGKRLTRSFGIKYDFQTGRVSRGDPLPDWLAGLRNRAATFAGVEPCDVAQCLLIRYDPGAGIGWHRDRPAYGHVIGVSLGAPAAMRFRRRVGGGFERASLPLDPRGAYHLCGEARHDWEHSIAEMERTRHSITFRTLSGEGRRRAASLD
ncbi:MAG: alpha-ketoglutarate-dependent dioxygenase AlkB [Sphingomonas sp.]|uniref:alpha-ketoglutarate-dependent dioxygenase AlkB n=1 Tax=Sphingomonas sp. TaxID=28214 RepID=UPI00120FFF7F|nr:alpha-ketoglutarate-dependent dioxygenase AlkB [Sphingomonas sp.]THD35084.1 MAG: alpha-ketoglutarate-dependent dioxygenase AlkB [Sphingomonas sp.]